MMTDSLALGVDLGATKIAATLIDRHGQVIDSRSALTHAHEGESAVLDRIAAQVGALIEAAPGAVDGLGLGSPGQVDPIHGVVRDAVNLGWREVQSRRRIAIAAGKSLCRSGCRKTRMPVRWASISLARRAAAMILYT